MALQEGINLLNKAKNLSGQSALAVLEQADDKFTDAISMIPAEARIFLNWGHVHRQRAVVYNSMGNSSEAEEQLRLAKDMDETALKANSMITEAKTSLADLDTLLVSSHPCPARVLRLLSQCGRRNIAGPNNASYKPVQVMSTLKNEAFY
jgi:tetratricopeptide (TPR) repeat protein